MYVYLDIIIFAYNSEFEATEKKMLDICIFFMKNVNFYTLRVRIRFPLRK